MIITLIIAACVAAVGLILVLLPAWTPVDFAGAISDLASGPGAAIFDGLGWMNYYLPVSEMLVLLVIQVTLWGTVKGVQFVLWLLQLFHIAGGST